jgi:putative holliday junction resolvase
MKYAPPTRRVLALDIGQRRIGVAISDDSGTLATPLTTINATPRPHALNQIARLIQEYTVQEVVVGLPLTLSGDIGPQARTTQEFATALETTLNRQITFFDERYTTAAAEQLMCELGIKPQKRKQRRDEIAASIILQDYLNHTRNAPPADYPPPSTETP